MTNQSEKIEHSVIDRKADINFDDLEKKLNKDLDEQLSELIWLEENREKISDPDNLGNTVMNVVWEQFLNQIAVTAGEDFIAENRGLNLDLRKDAHIQTTENFEINILATHNDKIDYQKRYNDYQDNFQKNEDGSIKINDKYKTGNNQNVLKKEAREPFDKGRDKGSKSVHKDHTVPTAEIMRDPRANAHLEKKEQIDFANSDINLNDLDAAANQSKGDRKMSEFLDSERNGEKPADRFNINEEELRERDRLAREEYEKKKDEGEQKSIETGKQSQKEEAFRITGMALRAVIMQILAELMKEVFRKLILWFKSAQKSMKSLLNSIKLAIKSFISQLKTHLINAGSTLLTTVATAIVGPIVRTIKKAWIMLKQGWKSVKEAIAYITNPRNINKPFEILILEVGKIVIAGLAAAGAIVLGEVIEKGLLAIPLFALEIPMLGSLASLIGLFLGGLVAGIIGALAISLIDKAVARQQTGLAIEKEIHKGNEILVTQNAIMHTNEKIKEQKKDHAIETISNRHSAAATFITDTMGRIPHKEGGEIIISENDKEFNALFNSLKKLQE